MVLCVGIEPTILALQVRSIASNAYRASLVWQSEQLPTGQFNAGGAKLHSAINQLVPRARIELAHPTCKEGVLPLY